MFKSQSEQYKVIVRKSKVPKMDWKEEIRDLSTSLNNFGSLKTYKGGEALKRPAPLCRFFSSQIFSNCCLRSRIFSFQSILACRGESSNYIWGTLDLLKDYFTFKASWLSRPPGGNNSRTTGTCESKVACTFPKNKSQEALNHVLIL